MNVVVVADTHLRSGIDRLPDQLVDALGRCDALIHAGDVVSRAALEGLRSLCPVHAVLGNNDGELVGTLPAELSVELGGVPIAIVHDSGQGRGRAGRLARLYPGAAIVVFGHSHVPVNELGVDGQLLFNPGSPTRRRSQPHHTFGRLRLGGGRILSHTIETLAPAPPAGREGAPARGPTGSRARGRAPRKVLLADE